MPSLIGCGCAHADSWFGWMNTLPWPKPTALTDEFGPGAGRGEDLANSLGIHRQGAQRHVPVFRRQHHILDGGDLGGHRPAWAGMRAGGTVVQTTDCGGGAVPCVVSPEFEARDPQDHGEREEWFCTGDGVQDTGLGVAFRQSLATSQAEPRCAQQCQKEPDNCREDSHSAIKLRDGIEQLLPVLVERLDGDDRAQTAPMPATNG